MSSALFVTTVAITLEAFLTPFADSLRSQGWRVDGLAAGAEGNPRIVSHFDALFDAPWSRNPLSPSGLGASLRVREIVARGGYDVVHVHTPVAAFLTRFALRNMTRRPAVIYTAHGFHFLRGGGPLTNAAYRTLERTAARWTDYLVTINAEDFEAAQRFAGIEPQRVRLIPGIGVDTDTFSPACRTPETRACVREELGIAPDARVITMVAEFAPVKRHAFALDAIERVTNPDAVFVFVGEGPLRAEIERDVQRRELSARVRFAGFRRDVPAVFAASDAGMLVSAREGLARCVLEALASGLPVFGTRTRGIADAVRDDAGWIAEKDDAAGLAAMIDAALADPAQMAARGILGRKRAEDEYAVGRIVSAYEDLYREALAHRS